MIGVRDIAALRHPGVFRANALDPCGRRAGLPRRARRGIAALFGVLMITTVLSSVVLTWQLSEIAAQKRAEAGLAIKAAEDAGFALHHWVHERRRWESFQEPALDVARRLSSSEELSLEASAAWAPWTRLPGGWRLELWVTTLSGDSDRELPHGVVLLVPDATVSAAARERVEGHFGTGSGGEDWQHITRESDGAPFVPSDVIAVAAWTQSRLNPTVVFREERAGHPEQGLAANIDLGGHDIWLPGLLSMETGDLDQLAPIIPYGMTVSGTVTASGTGRPLWFRLVGRLTADSVTLPGTRDLSVSRLAAANLEASGSVLDLEHLAICGDLEAENCAGGVLDLTDSTAEVSVFGTLSVAGTTTATSTEVGVDLLAAHAAATEVSATMQTIKDLNCAGSDCSWDDDDGGG